MFAPAGSPKEKLSIVLVLGIAQTIAWASTYYLPAVLAVPMATDFGIQSTGIFGLFSLALIVAAIAGPGSGRLIDRFGGKPILCGTSVLFALCLVLMAQASSMWQLTLAWLGIGIGLAGGLYEAAFATVVRLYGRSARGAITGITLLGGFASTLGWPLTAYLEAGYGWRSACLFWAAVNIAVCLPLYCCLPRREAPGPQVAADMKPGGSTKFDLRMALLAFFFSATAFSSAAMATHLPGVLQAAGITAAGAIMVGMLVGPSQVGARLLEFTLMKKLRPMLTAMLAVAMHPAGALLFLVFGAPVAALLGVFHGLGNGLLTIVKGALPLEIFGAQGYGERQGILMAPARLAQASAPWLFGLAVTQWGAGALALTTALGVSSLLALVMLDRHSAN